MFSGVPSLAPFLVGTLLYELFRPTNWWRDIYLIFKVLGSELRHDVRELVPGMVCVPSDPFKIYFCLLTEKI